MVSSATARSWPAWTRWLVLWFGLAVAVALGRPAVADPLQTYGAGSRAVAMGSAATALGDPEDGAHYNPAAVARATGVALRLGLSTHEPRLEVNDLGWDEPGLALLEFGTAVPTGLPWRAALGITGAVPTDGLYSLRQHTPQEVVFPVYGDRNRRLVLAWCVSVSPIGWLRAGLGLALMPEVPGSVSLDLRSHGPGNAVDIDISHHWSPRLGVEVDLPLGLTVGYAYRRGDHLTLDLTPIHVDVADGLPMDVLLTGPAFTSPDTQSLGLGWSGAAGGVRTVFAGDLTWIGWSSAETESPYVAVLAPDGSVARDIPVPEPGFHDTVRVGFGGEVTIGPIATRFGYAYEPSPIPPQEGVTNMLDSDRNVLSGGLGVTLPDSSWLPGDIRLDGHVQMVRLTPDGWEKREIMVGNPGYPTVRVAGSVWSAGLSVRLVP